MKHHEAVCSKAAQFNQEASLHIHSYNKPHFMASHSNALHQATLRQLVYSCAAQNPPAHRKLELTCYSSQSESLGEANQGNLSSSSAFWGLFSGRSCKLSRGNQRHEVHRCITIPARLMSWLHCLPAWLYTM